MRRVQTSRWRARCCGIQQHLSILLYAGRLSQMSPPASGRGRRRPLGRARRRSTPRALHLCQVRRPTVQHSAARQPHAAQGAAGPRQAAHHALRCTFGIRCLQISLQNPDHESCRPPPQLYAQLRPVSHACPNRIWAIAHALARASCSLMRRHKALANRLQQAA